MADGMSLWAYSDLIDATPRLRSAPCATGLRRATDAVRSTDVTDATDATDATTRASA